MNDDYVKEDEVEDTYDKSIFEDDDEVEVVEGEVEDTYDESIFEDDEDEDDDFYGDDCEDEDSEYEEYDGIAGTSGDKFECVNCYFYTCSAYGLSCNESCDAYGCCENCQNEDSGTCRQCSYRYCQ